MASIISAGTTSATALNMSADTSGVLQLASNNGTVAVTVDASQRVGIGTASPSVCFEVNGTGSGSANNWLFLKGGNTGGATFPGLVAGLAIGQNYSNGFSETALVWGQGIGSSQYFSISKGNGSTVSEQLRITSGGNLYLGTTSADGSVSNNVGIATGKFKTVSGSVVAGGSGAWQDIVTISNKGLYLVHGYIEGYNAGTSDWSNAWFVTYTGANNPFVATALGATGLVQLRTKPGSTTTLQLYTSAGAGITYSWVLHRID